MMPFLWLLIFLVFFLSSGALYMGHFHLPLLLYWNMTLGFPQARTVNFWWDVFSARPRTTTSTMGS